MTRENQLDLLRLRALRRQPWHGPPHGKDEGLHSYLISATCWEHESIIGKFPERMSAFEEQLFDTSKETSTIFGWCILPNHYHVLIQTEHLTTLIADLGKLHGRTSFTWNGEDNSRGRRVWHRCVDRRIRSAAHFWSTVNYIHHNPVKHDYVNKWTDWPYSSAHDFLESVSRKKAIELWSRYSITGYGDAWDH